MEIPSLIVSILAVVVAAGSLLHSVSRSRRTDRRLADEEDTRMEELALLRRQVEAQIAADEERKRARIVVTVGDVSHGAVYDKRHFTVTNTGKAAATSLIAVLLDSAGLPTGEQKSLPPILPGQSEALNFRVDRPLFRTPPDVRWLDVSWADDRGIDEQRFSIRRR